MRYLTWRFDGDDNSLKADHPYYHDQGSLLCYVITHDTVSEQWTASFEGHPVTMGPLTAVLMEVEKDARSPVGIPVALRTRGIK